VSRGRKAAGRLLAALLLIAAGLSNAAIAQTTASIEAGVTRVRYGDDPGVSLFAISPFVQFEQPGGWFAAMATVSAFESGGWGLQTTVTGSRFLPAAFGLRPELVGLAHASRGEDASRAGEAGGRLRMHWLGSEEGLWTGGGVGWADGLTGTHSVRSLEVGGWLRHEGVTMVLSLEPEWVGDSIRTMDAEGLSRLVRGPLELAVFGGIRQQRSPDGPAERWAGVSGAWWFGSRTAATVGFGSYPADLAREFGAGSYATISLRLASRRPEPAERADQPAYRVLPPLARPVVAGFAIEPADSGRRRVVVRAPGATGVEVMGDFTDWQPVRLRPAGSGQWTVELALSPGVHRLNIRLAGGEWGVPPGIPVVRDDFNGVVGLLTVE
jgi:hypothetical protein